jgi:hypothetical protein
MKDAYTTTLERLRQNSTAQKDALTTRLDTATQQDAAARGTLPALTRVFDSVLGKEGRVEASPPSAAKGSRVVFVRFDDGGLVAREPELLIVRPTPPAV